MTSAVGVGKGGSCLFIISVIENTGVVFFSYDQSSFLKPLNDFCIWLRGLNSPLSMLQSYDIEKKKKSFEISG